MAHQIIFGLDVAVGLTTYSPSMLPVQIHENIVLLALFPKNSFLPQKDVEEETHR